MQVTIQRSVHGPLQSALGDVKLAYANISRADFERRVRSRDSGDVERAKALLSSLTPEPFKTAIPVRFRLSSSGPI